MPLSRRQFLQATAVAGASLVAAPGRAPAFVRSRPVITHGVQSGEVARRSGVVWTRADRPSRMLLQVLDGRHGRRPRWIEGPVLTSRTDYAGKVRLRGLEPGQRVEYRVALQDLRNPAVLSEPQPGSFALRRCAWTWFRTSE
jgi:alkaline phosphatase D